MKNSINQPSQRQLRVGEQIKHVLADYLSRGHFHSEALMNAGTITVTEVRVSPDLKHATAYIVPLGGEESDGVLRALNDEAHAVQKEINRQTQLKFTPRMQFRNDDVFDKAARLENIISNLKYSDQDKE